MERAGAMSYVIWVDFELAEGAQPEFLRLVKANAQASLAGEPGCLRFDVLTPESGGAQVSLYEIYRDRAAFDAHLQADHFQRFDRAVARLVERKNVRAFHLHGSAGETEGN